MNAMNKFEKYPFFMLMILTSIIFGIYMGGRRISIANNDKKHQEEKNIKDKQEKKNEKPTEKIDSKIEEEQEALPIEGKLEVVVPFIERVKTIESVEENYLDGALFIGDSRTTILHDYGGFVATDFFVKNGLSIWTVLDTPLDTVSGIKQNLSQILEGKIYSKIYIMLGINELGEGNAQSFAEQFQFVLTAIAEKQPHAIIFLQEILHVTQQQDAKNSYINNGEINRRNEELKKIANGINIIYLPINEAFDLGGSGTLNPVFSGDGIHIQAKDLGIWKKYLLEHGVRIE